LEKKLSGDERELIRVGIFSPFLTESLKIGVAGAELRLTAPVFFMAGEMVRVDIFRLSDQRCNNSLGSSKIRPRHETQTAAH
jgi:hypothetical protein